MHNALKNSAAVAGATTKPQQLKELTLYSFSPTSILDILHYE